MHPQVRSTPKAYGSCFDAVRRMAMERSFSLVLEFLRRAVEPSSSRRSQKIWVAMVIGAHGAVREHRQVTVVNRHSLLEVKRLRLPGRAYAT